MKKKQTTTKTHLCQSKYDMLLEEFLPAVHKAAYSAPKKEKDKDAPKDLLLAGLKGLKDVFLQISDTNHHSIPRDVFLQAIHGSIMDQIRVQ